MCVGGNVLYRVVFLLGRKPCWAVLSRSVMSDSLRPTDCSLPGPSVHEDSPGKSSGEGCLALFQEIFSTQESNPGLPIAGGFFSVWVTREAQEYWSDSLSLLQGNFQANSRNRGFLHCRQILYQLSYLGSPGKTWEVTWEALSLWLIMKRSQHMAIWEKDLFCKRNSQQRCSYQKGDEKLLTYSGNSILSS